MLRSRVGGWRERSNPSAPKPRMPPRQKPQAHRGGFLFVLEMATRACYALRIAVNIAKLPGLLRKP